MSIHDDNRLTSGMPKPEYLSQHAAARRAGLADGRRVTRLLAPDAWMVGPGGKRWPLSLS